MTPRNPERTTAAPHWTTTLRELEDTIRRSPSAHNTQPWTLHYAPDHLRIGWDPDRELPAGDPTRRDLYLSLGALTETALIVAAHAGLPVRADIAVDPESRTAARLLPADDIHATPYTAATVQKRRCARGPYAPGRLTPRTLDRIASRLTHTGLMELPARDLAAATRRADSWLFDTPPVVRELRRWLRLTRGPAPDGLTADALALTRAEALGLRAALAAYAPLRRLGLPRLLAAAQDGLLDYDGSVLVLTGDPAGPDGLVEAGRDLIRVWYELTELGLAAHPLSQLLDCPRTAAFLTRRVGARPLAVFRAGRPLSKPPRSQRIPAVSAAA